MNEMSDYGAHDTRLGCVLPRVREAAPPEEWYHKAVEEVKEAQKTGARFIETSWGWRLIRRRR